MATRCFDSRLRKIESRVTAKSDARFRLTKQEREELFLGLANEIADEAAGAGASTAYRQRLATEPTEFERQSILKSLVGLSKLTRCDAIGEWAIRQS